MAGARGQAGSPRHVYERFQNRLFSAALLVLVTGTVAGFVTARDRAITAVDTRAERLADRSAQSLETEVLRAVAHLTGAGVVVGEDGTLDIEAFGAFAESVLAVEPFPLLQLAAVVPMSERNAFEQQFTAITTIDGARVVRAPPTSTHFPVLATRPTTGVGAPLGRDLGLDPPYRRALRSAERTGAARLGGVADSPDAGATLALVHPLVHIEAGETRVVGVVTTRVPMRELTKSFEEAAADGFQVALVQDDTVLLGAELRPGESAATGTATVLDSSFDIAVETEAGPDLLLAWLIATGGAAATTAMGILLVVTNRHQRNQTRVNRSLERSEQRSQAVQAVAGRLSRAISGSEVVQTLSCHLPLAVGAQSAVVATVNAAGELELLEPATSATAPGDEPSRLPPRQNSIIELTMRSGRPVWLSSPLEWRGDELADLLADGGWALAVLPLSGNDITGVLVVSYPRVHVFTDGEKASLETIGLMASHTLARGLRYDVEHQAAVAFQRAALPPEVPELDGLVIAACYRPAAEQAAVGGDWYDVLVLDERHVLLVVGDVVGHEMIAAATMGRLRTALQVITSITGDPGEILQAMNQQVSSIPDAYFTTMVCAVIDRETGTVRWCRAGHPFPLLLGHDRTRLLEESCLPALGLSPDAAPVVHELQLDAGDTLLLYTDGLIERRVEPIDQSFRRLTAAAGALVDLEPGEFNEALLEALVPIHEQSDDIAMLAVRFDGEMVRRAELG